MKDAVPFRLLSPSEYERLTVQEKLRYLEQAFRQSCSIEPAPASPPEAAAQGDAAESKI